MSKTVIAAFERRDSAERAINDLRSKGFDQKVSMLAKDDRSNADTAGRGRNDTVTNGVSTGGIIGGIAGLAAGAGALAIPGIGPLLALGPISGLLSGAATGGIVGGLADYGIPAERGRYYEDKIKQGNTLVTVRCEENMASEASRILSQHGAKDVEVH